MSRKPKFSLPHVFRTIERLFLEHGQPPTIEELRAALRLGSSRTVLRYLSLLEKEGYIERWAGARGIRLTRRISGGQRTVEVPLVGVAPAGPMMLAEENREGVVRLSEDIARPNAGPWFLLRVRGDSMNRATVRGKRIEDGDLVLVRQQSVAESGDIVVALVDGQATIKRLRLGSDYAVLNPESSNRSHQPFIVAEDFSVQGIIVDVLKRGQQLICEE